MLIGYARVFVNAPALDEKDLKQARALLADPEITFEDVARRLCVGPSTLYRYLPAAQQTAQEVEH